MISLNVSRSVRAVASPWLLPLAAALLACSGSGDPRPGTAPVVASLQLWQGVAGVGQGGGMIAVDYAVTVSDVDADATHVVATAYDAAGTQVSQNAQPVAFPRGQTTGGVMAEIAIPTAAVMTYAIEVQAFDARGGASNVLRGTFDVVQGNPAPAIASLTPDGVAAYASGFTLTVTGTGFVPESTVSWEGSALATTYVDATTLLAEVESYRLSYAATADVTVTNPPPGGGTSAPAPFVVGSPTPNPVPTLASISPSTVDAGAASATLTVTGTGFVPSSQVLLNGSYVSTTYVDATTLRGTLSSYDLASPRTATVAVSNPTPGGGRSSSTTLTVRRPDQAGVTMVALKANDVAWDPYQRMIYASVPGTSPVNPNTVTAIDPFTGALGASRFVGSEPDRLSISDDGRFLYVGLRGASSVERLTLPDLAPDLSIALGRDATYGAYSAVDVRVAPGAPRTIAVSRVAAGSSYASGVAVFDDATERPTVAANTSYSGFDSLQWGGTASTLYATSTSYGYDLYTLAVDASGTTLQTTYRNAFSTYGVGIRFDALSGLVYGDDGRVVDPATGLLAGTYPVTGLYNRRVLPDASLGSAFFLSGESYYGQVMLSAYDVDGYYPTASTTISYAGTPARRPIRWGVDGLAFLTPDSVVLVRGPAVLPASPTANPVPAVASVSPSSVTAGNPNLALAVTGSDFVRGATVLWNGTERATTFVSATELVAYLPASDLATAGSAEITVANPSPGGGASAAAAFTVTP